MEGTYRGHSDTYVTIKAAYGWNGLYDVIWLKPGLGVTGTARLSSVEVTALVRRLGKLDDDANV